MKRSLRRPKHDPFRLDPSSHVEISKGVSQTRTEDGMVLLDGRTGKYWTLDQVGTDMLESFESNASTAETIAVITAKYEVSTTTVESDVKALLRDLAAEGMVRIK
ncbi:lasso peptide biosynthesis PqqD family chaperone [Rhodococcoides corynebacterioides]|uniref:Lasso peptide biosynthesis PqqD family chaperone n=1 Tax=Rhodococcoides corynebacterioides TaxID=53972 RepID=A0ABS7P0Z9_9NOCA|nr:lasso peptide biosynthesis PqqD family chaperone [Rhodococcus corynebacterioides]MBY6350624.1 lasso peptide biosynthesis PqqD family chaperone [Rhodococcus corynebacterioides]MBY6366078.1 lasso peptide biosynthesis PqqD family chaperone [Rhodococcus corynebacterioides]MBY6406964.1 lasso peptide biosynthesis PqqD family chaperone [Rhodococcus corynebacterioides]